MDSSAAPPAPSTALLAGGAGAPATVTAGLARHARRAPDAPALTCDGTTLSYGRLDALVSRLAALFRTAPPGGIALDLPNGMLPALAFLAAARAGREAQLLDPGWPKPLRDTVLATLKPALVLTARNDAGAVDGDPGAVPEALPGKGPGARGMAETAAAAPEPAGPLHIGRDPDAAPKAPFGSASATFGIAETADPEPQPAVPFGSGFDPKATETLCGSASAPRGAAEPAGTGPEPERPLTISRDPEAATEGRPGDTAALDTRAATGTGSERVAPLRRRDRETIPEALPGHITAPLGSAKAAAAAPVPALPFQFRRDPDAPFEPLPSPLGGAETTGARPVPALPFQFSRDPDAPFERLPSPLGTAETTASSEPVRAIRLDPETTPEALPEAIAAALGRAATAGAVPEPDPALPFYVGFTSGSTGVPKGYRRSHRSWNESFAADAREFGIGPGDVVLAPGALAHSLFLYALAHGLHAGAHVLLARRFSPRTTLALARRHGASVVYGVPTQLALLLDALEAEDTTLDGVRLVLSSGAKWFAGEKARLARRIPGAGFAEFYGASELSFVTVAKDHESVPEGSVGRPFHGVRITIRDHAGRRRPTGRTGQVFVESPFLFDGYAMGSSADLLRHGAAMSVGDAGFLDRDGFLHLVGRAKRMIVTSGKNLYPEEVERLLERHPAVRAACVLGAPDAKRGERLTALLALAPDAPAPSAAALIAHLKPHLPLFKIPRRYGVVAQWPLTASGKSDFAALARLGGSAVRPLP